MDFSGKQYLSTPFDNTLMWGSSNLNHNPNHNPNHHPNHNPNHNHQSPPPPPQVSWMDWAKSHIADIAIIIICMTVIVILIFLALRSWFNKRENELALVTSNINGKDATQKRYNPLSQISILD